MLIVYICAFFWVFLPLLVFGTRWFIDTKQKPKLVAVAGAVGVNVSFFYLPWLDLSPVKGSLLKDLLDFAPDVAGQVLEWRGLSSAAQGMERVASVVGLFELSGWETLLLTSPHPLVLVLLGLLGVVAIALAVWTAWPARHPAVGYSLAVCSAWLLLSIIYYLPEIEGLGERAFPSLLAVAVPLFQVEIIWLGPLVMMLGLLLMLAGGLMQAQQTELDYAVSSNPDDGYGDINLDEKKWYG